MDMNRINNIAEKLNLPKQDISSIGEYLEYSEWGIALEYLCATIENDKICISKDDYNEIKELGEYMNMDEET